MAVEPFRKPRGQDAKAASQHMHSPLMGERVGHLLGQAREQRGESLADVAKALRIRQPYLEAIENGDHETLPGLTYAIGFVRTYATYLDLDVPDLVRRYKEEAGTAGAGADLHFPTPLPEGRIPTRAILVLALLLTAFAYVGWWWFSAEDRKVADLIPTLPDSISNLLEEPAVPAQPAAQPVTPTPEIAAAPAPAPAPAATDSAPVEPAGTSAEATQDAPAQPDTSAPIAVSPAPVTVPTAQAPAAAVSVPGPTTVTPAPAGATSSSPTVTPPAQGPATGAATAPALAPAPADDQESVATQEAETDTAPPDPEPIAPEAPAAAASAADTPEASAPSAAVPSATAGRVFGTENSSSRIEVTATGDAWVEFRDASGQLVFTRVLRAGDVYHVPNQPGLRLQTGNAGALAFKVDGTALPPIGPAGSVRRNVLIEPEALQSSGAETQPPANAN